MTSDWLHLADQLQVSHSLAIGFALDGKFGSISALLTLACRLHSHHVAVSQGGRDVQDLLSHVPCFVFSCAFFSEWSYVANYGRFCRQEGQDSRLSM